MAERLFQRLVPKNFFNLEAHQLDVFPEMFGWRGIDHYAGSWWRDFRGATVVHAMFWELCSIQIRLSADLLRFSFRGDYVKVTVCDLAARLTALGFDGDAQHAAVLAARCHID